MVLGSGSRMPGRYSTAHKNSIHQDERNLLRMQKKKKKSFTKGGGGSLSVRQVAGDLALILSDMNNRFC